MTASETVFAKYTLWMIRDWDEFQSALHRALAAVNRNLIDGKGKK